MHGGGGDRGAVGRPCMSAMGQSHPWSALMDRGGGGRGGEAFFVASPLVLALIIDRAGVVVGFK